MQPSSSEPKRVQGSFTLLTGDVPGAPHLWRGAGMRGGEGRRACACPAQGRLASLLLPTSSLGPRTPAVSRPGLSQAPPFPHELRAPGALCGSGPGPGTWGSLRSLRVSSPYSHWQVGRRGSANPQLMPAPRSPGPHPSMTHTPCQGQHLGPAPAQPFARRSGRAPLPLWASVSPPAA